MPSWVQLVALSAKSYICGYCGHDVSSHQGYRTASSQSDPGPITHIYICHRCNRPTYFSSNGDQVPGPAFGGSVAHLPSKEVEALYDEARNCMKVNAYTAAVMCCRKLLMNVAVSAGAVENKGFAYYVKYLAEEGHIPPKATTWVDHIRDKGNDANHEIRIMNREDAERLIKFSEMLLRIMYEYPAEVEDPS